MVALLNRYKGHIFASKKMIKRKSTDRMKFKRKKEEKKNIKKVMNFPSEEEH